MNLIHRLRHLRFTLTGYQHGRAAQRPQRPQDAQAHPLGPDTPITAHTRPYRLLSRTVLGHRPHFDLPDGWLPRAADPLERSLPFAWDDAYQTRFQQPFQPVMLWRNALVLCDYIEQETDPKKVNGATSILRQLVTRMQEYTVQDQDAAWLESRFDYQSNATQMSAPWVSGINNAFALLACLRMRKHLPTLPLARAFAHAYHRPYVEGQPRPDRWITARDARGYLWFEEYPAPQGRLLHVKNGHIFAVLALHEMSLIDPQAGHGALINAGITTIEAYAPCLRRPGQISLYAVNGWEQPDYLPARAVRQLYQLYDLTGTIAFLDHGDRFLQDAGTALSKPAIADMAKTRETVCARRAVLDT